MDSPARITIDPAVMGGRPTIRKMRFTVVQMLELLAGGMTVEEILEDYPYVEREDVFACLEYAVKASNTRQVVSFA
ncbi:MAG: DUF433 domain-containing protein [Bacteroidota bacterium]